ncbi:hypothetical protein NT6N_39050 [Oceaniferula spumae]|uniref:Uncharacterized protein n=1 Tax=Oceaniferula spumae TaxID=2979115 RepID=A0AAT9FS63_9BACT
MLHLPKKRPWLILVFIYVVIITVWTTFIVLGHKQGSHMSPEEAEQHIRSNPPTHARTSSNAP